VSWTQKRITTSITLGSSASGGGGSFSGGGNSLTLSGLRTTCDIDIAGGGTGGATLESLIIYGMTKSQMNQASLVGKTWNTGKPENYVTIEAGDNAGMTTVFKGAITHATIDAMSAPQVRFIVAGSGQVGFARMKTPVISMPGAIEGKALFQQIAQKCGLQFEDGGIKGVLRNPYLWGSPITMARHLAQALKCQWCIDQTKGALAAWPSGGSRQSSSPVISKATGMFASPSFDNAQMIVKTAFNPSIIFGGPIQVQSDVVNGANQTWNVIHATLELDALTPHGRWFQTLTCLDPGAKTNQTPLEAAPGEP